MAKAWWDLPDEKLAERQREKNKQVVQPQVQSKIQPVDEGYNRLKQTKAENGEYEVVEQKEHNIVDDIFDQAIAEEKVKKETIQVQVVPEIQEKINQSVPQKPITTSTINRVFEEHGKLQDVQTREKIRLIRDVLDVLLGDR